MEKKELFCIVCNKLFQCSERSSDQVARRNHRNRSLEHKKLLAENFNDVEPVEGHPFHSIEERMFDVVNAQSHLNSFRDRREVVTDGNRRQRLSSNFDDMYWNEMMSPNADSSSNLFDLLESRNDDMNSEYSYISQRSETNNSSHNSLQSSDDMEEEEEDEEEEEEEEVLKSHIDVEDVSCNNEVLVDDDSNSVDSYNEIENPPEGSTLLKHECRSNEIKVRQDLLVYFFYDNFPAKLNRIGGRE